MNGKLWIPAISIVRSQDVPAMERRWIGQLAGTGTLFFRTASTFFGWGSA